MDGDGALPFAINALTGEITVHDPGDLDYESRQSFSLGVRVQDSFANLSEIETIEVSLTDVFSPVVVNLPSTQNYTGFLSLSVSSGTAGLAGQDEYVLKNAADVVIGKLQASDVAAIQIAGRDSQDDQVKVGASILGVVPISYAGGVAGNDRLTVAGSGSQSVLYTPAHRTWVTERFPCFLGVRFPSQAWSQLTSAGC